MTLRDVLFCLFQDLLRITVIDFVKALVCRTSWNVREHAESDFIFIVYEQHFRGARLISVKIGERI